MARGRMKNKNKTQIPPTIASSPSAPSPPPPLPPWTELPEDLTANILGRFGAEELLTVVEKVCTTWNKVCRRDPSIWRVVHLSSKRRADDWSKSLHMCLCAVDRSRGQLTDLTIKYFGDDEMLNYIAVRCRNLRRLTLKDPSDVSSSGLTDAVKKLPRLEALHVTNKTWLEPRDAETIGRSCPHLKSFNCGLSCRRINSLSCNARERLAVEYKHTTLAFAIARTMPGLHQLELYGDTMTNEGLEAILDGCPHLVSLNIRNSYGLDLKDRTLVERCSKQIKEVTIVLGRTLLDDLVEYYRDYSYLIPRRKILT